VLLEMRLCERMNMSPAELEATPLQKIADWVTVMGQEAELAKEKETRG
jgi:hypothetical protein